jgi:TonB family protein
MRPSSKVSAGLLLAPIRPVHPPIAKAAHVEGTVVVEAVISKAGTIESLRVVGGPPMLQTAAMEAIRAATKSSAFCSVSEKVAIRGNSMMEDISQVVKRKKAEQRA